MNKLRKWLIRRFQPRRMRRVRARLTFMIYLIVITSSLLTLLLTVLIRNGIIFQRDTMEYVLFGFAAKDVILLVVCIASVVITTLVTSHSTANPIMDLTRAAQEIASGNFDVTVDARGKHISEFSELQRSFNLMAQELKSNEYLRKDFIANVSHELKTPLSIISGYARLLEEDGLTEDERVEYTRLIADESDRLTELINNMLRLSRIDYRQIMPRTESFPLEEYLRQTILYLEPKWTAAGVELDLDIPDVDFTGDAELLSQVWSNLLDNAIKFTPPGGTISVTLRETPAGVTVTIADTGIGMDETTASRIFEQFYRGDTSRKREGSGLGLPLARRIVELHGGAITVKSQPGKGSSFTVILPRRP